MQLRKINLYVCQFINLYTLVIFLCYSLDTGSNAGAAWRGEICSNNLNIGYIKDDGSFSGVLGATHELGHL